MTKIALRTYNREIENMIERGQVNEAIDHCKYILKQYPKHLETYRLLGKCFLESQRYTEAADVLERVLAAIPDDFIAHLGMSIIREDEGNLDAAIWHMERVYEVQSSNTAIQSELRRLYGRRDGIEPPKIRLTRGALVRMYAKGELFPQATAEIRAALSEDPKRVDLEAILANVYYKAGRKVEAIEICSRIVSKASYCFEANRILAEVLPSTSRSEDAAVYQSRLQAMDPYAAYVSQNAPTIADVPDQAVQIERMEWRSSPESSDQPAWAQSIGLQWEDTAQETEPDWLVSAKENNSLTPDNEVQEVAADVTTSAETVLPDFLAGAGWSAAAGDATSIPESQLSDETDSFTLPTSVAGEELAEAEIPDWLAAMAPPSEPETTVINEGERSEWLSNILETGSGTEASPEIPTDNPIDDSAILKSEELDTPAWLSDLPAESISQDEGQSPETDIPDWLSSITQDSTPQDSTIKSDELSTPEWLAALTVESPDEPKNPKLLEETPPGWLGTLTEETSSAEPTLPIEGLPQDLMASISSDTSEDASLKDEKDLPDWLADFTAEETKATEPISTPGEEPEWLASATESGSTETEPIPDWLASITNDQEQTIEEIPSLENIELPASSDITASDLPEIELQLPDLEPALEEPVSLNAPAQDDQPTLEITSDIPPQEQDIDSALAWLEGLAVKQGTDEDFLLIKADQRTAQPPEWLTSSEVSIEPEPENNLNDVTAEIALTALVEPVDELIGQDEAPSEEIPEWLTDLVSDEVKIEEPSSVQPEEPVEILPTVITEADILASSSTVPEDETAPPLLAEEEISSAEAPSSTMNDMDSALAWLEALAVKQGADSDFLFTSESSRTNEPPEWVKDQIETSDQVETTPDITPESQLETEEQLSDILQEFPKGEVESEITPADVIESVSKEEEISGNISIINDVPIEIISEVKSTVEDQPAVESGAASETEIDAALAWLESLAAKQGADSDFLFVDADKRTEQPPEWVTEEKASAELAQIEAQVTMESTSLEIDSEPTIQSIEDVSAEPLIPENTESIEFREIADIPTSAPIVEPEPVAPELPDWLKTPAEPISQEIKEEEGVEDWLASIADESSTRTIEQPESVEWIPESEFIESKLTVEEVEPEHEFVEAVVETPDRVQETVQPNEPAVIQPEIVTAKQEAVMEIPITDIPDDPKAALELAKNAILSGKIDSGLDIYNSLIQSDTKLEDVIHDLREALYRYPIDISIWQTLGDAYARNNSLQDAIDAYTKAEELLR